MPQLDKESCNEDKEYRLISGDEEEVPDPFQTQDYDIPTTLHTTLVSKVRPKTVSK